jgi:hypothetical protein
MGTTVPQRVTLLYWGERPPTTVLALVVEERQLQLIRSPVELAEGGPPADVVVVDVPAKYRRVACEQVRRHYRGRLVVLLDPEDSSYDLPPDPNRTLLTHPFDLHELSAALAGSAPVQPTGDPRLILPPRAQVEDADSSPGMERRVVAEVVPWLAPWWEGRLVRLSTISVTAAVLLVVAFVLASRGTGCGSACDRLIGADLTAPSSSTITAAAVGPAATASSVGPTAAGGSQADPATSSSPGSTGTTAGPSGASSPSSPPDPTRPPSTAPPPTTAPPTTTTSTATTTTAPPHPTPPPHPTKP